MLILNTRDKIMKYLTPLEINDLTTLSAWLCNEDVYKNLYVLYYPVPYEKLVKWYNKKIDEGDYIYKYTTDDNIMKGVGIIHYIHEKNLCGELSIIIDPQSQGQGHGTELMKLLLDFSFRILNLHKVFFHTASFNETFKAMAAKIPGIVEGTYREELYYNGKYYDILRYGVLRSEYLQD